MSGKEDKEMILRQIRDAVANLPSLRAAYLYGSFLSRTDFRDIDIALLTGPDIDSAGAPVFASRAATAIETAIGFRYECDVRVMNDEPAWFRYEVISTGVPVYVRSEEDRIGYETDLLVEYQDLKYMYDLFDRDYLARA
nr:nucleotidyltransferase domain-containing protein [uncultured Methanoregula sp.]